MCAVSMCLVWLQFETIQEVVDSGDRAGRAVGDMPSMAARKLFEPMAAGPAEPEMDLVIQIGVSMADMHNVAEMAMLWSEVAATALATHFQRPA